MGRKKLQQDLAVFMNGVHVGQWNRRSEGEQQFHYAPSWLAEPGAVPLSLSMPLSSQPYRGALVTDYFDNLLPDNAEIRRRLQTTLGAASPRSFDLLASMGGDCVGALQILPPDTSAPDVRRVDAKTVDERWIGDALRSHGSRPLGIDRDEDFRISIAGAQEKTALLRHRGRWKRPRGATPTSHILKLPIGPAAHGIDLTDSVENEWLCLRIVEAVGLPAARAEMHEFDGAKALVVERFDRTWSADRSWLIRVPQEDVCQALAVPMARKYEADGGPGTTAVLDLLRQTIDPEVDRSTFFRAQVVFFLLAAIDGHAKNFSLFLKPGGRCQLAPLYDVLSAHPIVANGQLHERKLKMAMAVTGTSRHYHWHRIQARHWLSTAQAARFPVETARQIVDDVRTRMPAALRTVGDELPPTFPARVAEPILGGVERALRRLEF